MDGTGGPELDLRGVCFVGVPVKLAPNRLDPEPENDGKEGVKAPNIVVCSQNIPRHVMVWATSRPFRSFSSSADDNWMTLYSLSSHQHHESQRYPRRIRGV